MPPVKGDKTPSTPLNTSTQIQQIFAEVQSQLPSVDFDTDDSNDAPAESDILESTMSENPDVLLDSLLNPRTHSFLTLHPKIETPQQPPSVELQMRLSPNPIDGSSMNLDQPTASSILSMDLFNSIDFDRIPANPAPLPTLTPTFNRPRPMRAPTNQSFARPSGDNKNRDDRQILELLAQQAARFRQSGRASSTASTKEPSPLQNLESALFPVAHELDRHGRRSRIPEAQRKTIYIDLRHSQVAQADRSSTSNQSEVLPRINPISEQQATVESSSSDDDDDDEEEDRVNDGMLWFEKRQLAKRQQQQQEQQQRQPKPDASKQ